MAGYLVVDASFEWETIEQYFLWQLIAVHNIPVEHIMPVLPKMDFTGSTLTTLTLVALYVYNE